MTNSKEFFINLKSVPDLKSVEYQAFFEEETRKMKEGVTIDGVKITGWLYFYLNHWTILLDKYDEKMKESFKTESRPYFRDLDLGFAESLERAKLEQKGIICIGSRNTGKALKNDSLLYTETGITTIGEVQIGDKIMGADGKLTSITGVFPQGEIDLYRITLGDGRTIDSCENHVWNVYNKSRGYVNLQLKDFKDNYLEGTRKYKECKYYIKNCDPVEFKEKAHIVSPYLLGVILGDGGITNTSIVISSADPELIYRCQQSLLPGHTIKPIPTSKYGYALISEKRQRNFYRKELQRMELMGNKSEHKHIPKEYLFDSIENRFELLAGLLDTDGSISDGTIEYSTSSERLKDDVVFLARSLGIKVKWKMRKTKCLDSYRVYLDTNENLFRLKRKVDRWVYKKKVWKTGIRKIEYIGKSAATCIMVDNEDKLFLTNDFTVTHNSYWLSSLVGYYATLFKNSECVVSGPNTKDIGLVTEKIDLGLKNLPNFYKFGRIEDNWARQVTLGFKDKKTNERFNWSKITVRCHDEGHNTEIAAGTRAKVFILDEAGKSNFIDVFNAAKATFDSQYGWMSVPLAFGTGGSFEKGNDAREMFHNPDAYNMISFEGKIPGKMYGWFLDARGRNESLEKMNAAERFGVTKKGSELHEIDYYKANHEKGYALCMERRSQAETSNDRRALLKEMMYYPLTEDECFLTDNGNQFPVQELQRHKQYLLDNKTIGTNVWLHRSDNGEVKATFAAPNQKPIDEFPVKPNSETDVPIVIYEHPDKNPVKGLYIAGGDPYNQSSSATSTSLGTIYIYKRMSTDLEDSRTRCIVASYAARPEHMKKWHENVELLLDYYNAVLMPENEGTTLIQYFDQRKKIHRLANGFQLVKELTPNTQIKNRDIGLPATKPVINHCMALLLEYCKEEITIGYDDMGLPVKRMGLIRIPDPMLCEELINYRDGGNFDRIVAMRHVIAYDESLMKYKKIVKVNQEEEERQEQISYKMNPFIIGSYKQNSLKLPGLIIP